MVAVGVLQTISKILLIKDRKELDEIELWQFYWISNNDRDWSNCGMHNVHWQGWPPKAGRGGQAGGSRPAELLALLLCKKVADVCCIEKKKASIFLSCSSKKLRLADFVLSISWFQTFSPIADQMSFIIKKFLLLYCKTRIIYGV